MPGDVYSQRMQELDGKKAEKVQLMFPDISRPAPLKQGVDIGANLQPGQQIKEKPVEADMNSLFGQLLDKYKGQDSRFEQLTNDYTALVSGLKEQVQAGMMPEVIAKQRMQQFLMDGRNYFMKNKAKPMDNPMIKGAVDGMMQGAMEMGGPAQPEGGAPAPAPAQAPAQPAMPQGGM